VSIGPDSIALVYETLMQSNDPGAAPGAVAPP